MAAVFLAALLLVAYAAWLLWSTENALSRAAADGRVLKTAITAGDDATVESAMSTLRKDADRAERRTSGPVWSLLTHAPWLGDDARGVRVVSQVASELSSGGLVKLATQASDLDSILPSGGRVDLAKLTSLAPTVTAGHLAAAQAERRLGAQDPAGFIGPLRSRYRELQAQVEDAASALDAADTAVQIMPAMLGQDGPKHYLMVLQNNAEIRATGGLPGALSVLQADDGRLSMTKQVAGNSFGQAPEPMLPLTSTERSLYGDQLGTYFIDANFTPEFPRTAALMRARWETIIGDHIDGVISVDTVVLSYLLRATGPIAVDGVTLDSGNVIQELLHNTYVRILDPDQEDVFFRKVTNAVFEKITDGVRNPEKVIGALRQGAVEHRILVHDFTSKIQRRLTGTVVAGELKTSPSDHPQVGVYFNDSTGAKMSYFLRYQATVTSTGCTGDTQNLTAHLTIGSNAPSDAADLPRYITGYGLYGVPPGGQVVTVMLFGPLGGSMTRAALNGVDASQQQTYNLDNQPVTKLWVSLAPGQKDEIAWTMKSGAGQTGSTTVSMTPSIVSGNSESTVESTCK